MFSLWNVCFDCTHRTYLLFRAPTLEMRAVLLHSPGFMLFSLSYTESVQAKCPSLGFANSPQTFSFALLSFPAGKGCKIRSQSTNNSFTHIKIYLAKINQKTTVNTVPAFPHPEAERNYSTLVMWTNKKSGIRDGATCPIRTDSTEVRKMPSKLRQCAAPQWSENTCGCTVGLQRV